MKTALLLVALVALPCSGQVRTFSLDARPVGGVLAVAWRAANQTYIGVGLGAGTDELGRTLRPRDEQALHDFEQLLNFDLFVRHKPRSSVDFDAGLRAGIGGVRECTASDCLPGVYAGAYVGVFFGSARWKLGTRLIAARVVEGSFRDNVVHWEPIALRYSR